MKRKFTKEEKLQIIKESSEQGVKETHEKYAVYAASFAEVVLNLPSTEGRFKDVP